MIQGSEARGLGFRQFKPSGYKVIIQGSSFHIGVLSGEREEPYAEL